MFNINNFIQYVYRTSNSNYSFPFLNTLIQELYEGFSIGLFCGFVTGKMNVMIVIGRMREMIAVDTEKTNGTTGVTGRMIATIVVTGKTTVKNVGLGEGMTEVIEFLIF